jgi:predicted nucleic acid-binding protein
MLDFENSQNINSLKADEILKWAELASDYNIGDEETLIIGSHLEKIGLRQADAMHVALAIQSRCDYFITTDDGILKRAPYIDRIFIINPVDFILKQEKNHEE